LNLEKLKIDRNQFVDELRARGVGCSVHWRPLSEHPYYQETFAWKSEHCPVAASTWVRMISLPLFSGMRAEEIDHVVKTVQDIAEKNAR
jgi:perosamine synthetase